jgi:hypothetical protein
MKGRVITRKVKQVKVNDSMIDKAINNVSGSANYMKDMEYIVGNVFTIDKPFYVAQLKRVKGTYTLIMNNTKNINHKFFKEFATNWNKLDLDHAYKKVTNKKTGKTKEKLSVTPKDIISSQWFAQLRQLDVIITNLIDQFKIESADMSDETTKIINENPNTVDAFKFFGRKISDEGIHQIVFVLNKFVKDVFEVLLNPMYDYQKYIVNHWLPQIDAVVSARANKNPELKGLKTEDTQKYVGLFAKAKYRLGLTENTNDFTKVFLDVIGESEIANLDAARFMDILDTIDVSSIDKTGKLQQTLELTKMNIEKAKDSKFNLEEVVKDFETIINMGNEEEEQVVTSTVEDIF